MNFLNLVHCKNGLINIDMTYYQGIDLCWLGPRHTTIIFKYIIRILWWFINFYSERQLANQDKLLKNVNLELLFFDSLAKRWPWIKIVKLSYYDVLKLLLWWDQFLQVFDKKTCRIDSEVYFQCLKNESHMTHKIFQRKIFQILDNINANFTPCIFSINSLKFSKATPTNFKFCNNLASQHKCPWS